MIRSSLYPVCFLSLLTVFLFGGCRQKAESGGEIATPAAAPEFSLKNLSGQTVRLADYRGKIVVLDFWATWCPPCRKEIPDFVQLQKDYGEKGVQILGISVDRGGTKLLTPFAEKYKINYPILLSDGKVDQAYGGITGIPTTFIIDQIGRAHV